MKTEQELKQMSVVQLTDELRKGDELVQTLRAYMQIVHDELETKEVVAASVESLKKLSGPHRERLLLEIGPGVDESAVGKP
jgi:hypothetical protein